MFKKALLPVFLLSLLSAMPAGAGEVTVTSESGGDGPGTFYTILSNAEDDDIIVFASDVRDIRLDWRASSKAKDLVVRGGDVGFGTELGALLRSYGVDGNALPPLTDDGFAGLAGDVANLPELLVHIGTAANFNPAISLTEPLLLFNTDGTTVSLSNLAFDNIDYSLETDDIDNSEYIDSNMSARATLHQYGSGINIRGEGKVMDSLLFQNNAIEFATGNTVAGTSTGAGEAGGTYGAVSEADSGVSITGVMMRVMNVRGGTSEHAGVIANSALISNTAVVSAGTAVGGVSILDDADGDYRLIDADASAIAVAQISGGASIDLGDIENSLFAYNGLKAVAGAAKAGESSAESKVSQDPEHKVSATAVAQAWPAWEGSEPLCKAERSPAACSSATGARPAPEQALAEPPTLPAAMMIPQFHRSSPCTLYPKARSPAAEWKSRREEKSPPRCFTATASSAKVETPAREPVRAAPMRSI